MSINCIFIVTEHEPDSEFPVVVKGLFSTRGKAEGFIQLLESESDSHSDDLWWEIDKSEVDALDDAREVSHGVN